MIYIHISVEQSVPFGLTKFEGVDIGLVIFETVAVSGIAVVLSGVEGGREVDAGGVVEAGTDVRESTVSLVALCETKLVWNVIYVHP